MNKFISQETALDYDDVLIVPRCSEISSRKDIDLFTCSNFLHSGRMLCGIPIIAANMHGVGTISMAQSLSKHHICTALTKDVKYDFKLDKDLNIAWSISPTSWNKDNYTNPDSLFCLDVANGYTKDFISFVKEVRSCFPRAIIIAGNVATPEGVMYLVEAGADIVKVGIGPGSVCTTRLKTGVGVPQLSAVMECAEVAHELGAHIIADGGCKNPGDVCKAFAAGADFVMLGGMLAGHDESEQKRTEFLYREFHGNAYYNNEDYKTAEGKSVLIEDKGPVEKTIKDILGGLRSCCTYVGAHNLEELKEKAYFVKVNRTHNKVFE